MNNKVKALAIIIGAVLSIVLNMVLLSPVKKEYNKKKYNNGVCAECGGEYVYNGYHYHAKNDYRHVYICDTCGNKIEIFHTMD